VTVLQSVRMLLCSRCECHYPFTTARTLANYINTLLLGGIVGLVIGSFVMSHQTSILENEKLRLVDQHDLETRISKDCHVQLGIEVTKKKEKVEQMGRILEGLKLDKDILTQLRVNLRAKVRRKIAGIR